MSVFTRRTEPTSEARGSVWPGYPFPPSQFTGRTTAGQNVTIESYVRDAAASACVRVLVSTIKKLPVKQYRNTDTITEIPASQVIRRPSSRTTQRGWVAQVVRSLASAGNAYGDVVATRPGSFLPTQVETISPSRVTWSAASGEWKVSVDGKPRDLWPLGDLWHCPATDWLPAGQPHALSPVELHSTSIGTSLAAEEFGARFFGDGAHPSALIYSDQDLTAPQAEDIKTAFLNAIQGTRSPAVFGSGLKYEKLQIDPKDSQFIDLMRFEVEQACRRWGVPPVMVFAAISGQSVTYANVSQGDLQFLKHSVDNWLVDVEDALSLWLPQPQVVKFDTKALLRMDAEARWKIHDLRLKNKTTSVNKVLFDEDELPFPDPEFDKPGIPGGVEKPAPAVNVAPPVADSGGTAQ